LVKHGPVHIEQGGNFLHKFALLYQGLRVFNVLFRQFGSKTPLMA